MLSIWFNNAFEASLKIKCASSINMINSGFPESPCSGNVSYNSANKLSINVENNFGLSCMSVNLIIFI